MNYLQLCQRTHQECGLSGQGPQAVTNQNGVNAKLVAWVQQAWNEIQLRRPDWRWAWREGTLDTVVGQRDYPLPGKLHPGSVRCAGTELVLLNYLEARDRLVAAGRPYAATVLPSGEMRLLSEPDEVYPITFDYTTAPQVLVSGTDTPDLPPEFHIAIVYLAVTKYAAHDDHPQLFQDAKYNWEYWFGKLVDNETIGAASLGVPLDEY